MQRAGCGYARTGRLVLAWVVAGVALAFSRAMFDVFSGPKLLLVVAGACAVAGTGVIASVRGHRLGIPAAPAVWAALAFAVLAVVATVTSASPARSVVGASAAHAGLALYLACVVLFLGATALYRGRSPAGVIGAVLVAAAPAVAYGFVQALGLDPLAWRATAGGPPVFSTFGNANFFSAWTGVVAVLAVWGGTFTGWSSRVRRGCGLLALAALGVALASASIQGPIAALAGVGVLAAARISDHGRHVSAAWRRSAMFLLPVAMGAAAGLVLLTRGDAATSFANRTGKWQAAVSMMRARPLTGFGLDLFGDWYHSYRPASDAVARGLRSTADAAHSVVLQLAAGGGVPLAAVYLLFVAAVGITAWRAIRRAHGEQRVLLGALAGAWVAYQVQAAVSIDVPPLAVLHWVLAGLLVAAAAPPDDAAAHEAHRPWSTAGALAATLAACLVVFGLSVPLRADLAARRGMRQSAQGLHASAERSFGIALRLAPAEPRYPLALARERMERGDRVLALDAYALAAGRAPRSVPITVERARATAAVGRHDQAAAHYAHALALDPKSPHLLVEAARHLLRSGDPGGAARLLVRAVDIAPRPSWARLLERASQAAGSA